MQKLTSLPVRRSIFNLISINALVCGIEIVSSCAFTYIPPLLLKSGFTESAMTVVLGIAPFIDLITVPGFAEWSDQCTSPIGRRRPFILALSTILVVSLVLIPSSPKLSSIIIGTPNSYLHMGSLAVGVILLDYSYQALFNPCETLLSDLMSTSDENTQTLGFTIHAACVSLGCIIGYLVVYVQWTLYIPTNLNQAQLSFIITAILLFPCLLLTLSNKEEPHTLAKPVTETPDRIVIVKAKYLCGGGSDGGGGSGGSGDGSENSLILSGSTSDLIKDIPSDGGYESGLSDSEELIFEPKFQEKSFLHIKNICRRTAYITVYKSTLLLRKLPRKLASVLLFIPCKVLSFPHACYGRVQMSSCVMQRLFFMELFGWTALICHNMFYTDFVGQYIYKGDPNAAENSTAAVLYDEGVRMGSWGLFLHSLIACLYAFFIQGRLVSALGSRFVFLGGLSVFAVGMLLTPLSPSIHFLNTVTALSGIGFAAISTTPTMLVTLYCQNRKVYMEDIFTNEESSLSFTRGTGSEVAVIDTAYYISQIMLSICVGPVVDLAGSAVPYMLIAAIASFAALYCGTKVVFNKHDMKKLQRGVF